MRARRGKGLDPELQDGVHSLLREIAQRARAGASSDRDVITLELLGSCLDALIPPDREPPLPRPQHRVVIHHRATADYWQSRVIEQLVASLEGTVAKRNALARQPRHRVRRGEWAAATDEIRDGIRRLAGYGIAARLVAIDGADAGGPVQRITAREAALAGGAAPGGARGS